MNSVPILFRALLTKHNNSSASKYNSQNNARFADFASRLHNMISFIQFDLKNLLIAN